MAKIFDSELAEPGTKFYYNHIGRALAAGIVGKNGLNNGLYIIASHIDSPRLDLKPKPLYEDSETNTALLKTQYYGGVKKYQWVNIPLALHGRIFTKDGRVVKVNLGEEEDDPVLLIPDLLPHISKMQRDRKLFEGIEAEELNAVAGSRPGDYKEEKFKSHMLKLLKDRYNVEEEDFASAELALVPAGKARAGGFDSSLVIVFLKKPEVKGKPGFEIGNVLPFRPSGQVLEQGLNKLVVCHDSLRLFLEARIAF